MKCDHCDNLATVHLIEIKGGKKIEKHLCEEHAIKEGVAVKVQSAPINDLLEKFVLKHSGPEATDEPLLCPSCDTTYDQFRKNGVLGCPDCYSTFAEPLKHLLERAHEGASKHFGKVPQRAGIDEIRQQRLIRLRRDLEDAVTQEQYERAAQIRDELEEAEID